MSAAEKDDQAARAARRRARIAVAILLAAVVLLFLWRPAGLDLWVKAVHIIAVISWMAGLLYLPRLFVYHSDTAPGSEQSETFKMMEERLLKVIMRPAMSVTWLLGLWLGWSLFGFAPLWLWLKIACVVGLTATHIIFARAVKDFAADRRTRPARHWRMMNEVPTVLMIAIVLLVVLKPF